MAKDRKEKQEQQEQGGVTLSVNMAAWYHELAACMADMTSRCVAKGMPPELANQLTDFALRESVKFAVSIERRPAGAQG